MAYHFKIFGTGTKDNYKNLSIGCQDNVNLTFCVGNSKNNSKKLVEIEIVRHQLDSEHCFELIINGQQMDSIYFDEKTKEFSETTMLTVH